MTRNELVEAVADYFGLEYPEKDDNGQYITRGYDWEAGCYSDHVWMSLANFVEAVEPLCEDEGDYDDDDWWE